MPRRGDTATVGVPHEAFTEVALALVQAGRVVPGLTIEPGGRGRSWWWPLPAASHRTLVATLVDTESPDGQRVAAARLAGAVDRMVRQRLVDAKVVVTPRRSGRATVPEAWARSLVSADRGCPARWIRPRSAPSPTRSGFGFGRGLGSVGVWVRSGAVVGGRVRLCLRVHEPDGNARQARRARAWRVELLA